VQAELRTTFMNCLPHDLFQNADNLDEREKAHEYFTSLVLDSFTHTFMLFEL